MLALSPTSNPGGSPASPLRPGLALLVQISQTFQRTEKQTDVLASMLGSLAKAKAAASLLRVEEAAELLTHGIPGLTCTKHIRMFWMECKSMVGGPMDSC